MAIERLKVEGWEVYRLENREISASIAPALGANIFRLKDKKVGHSILRSPPTLAKLRDEPVLWGTPILFPPNRIRGGAFDFRDKHYKFPINTPDGHHIHGLLLDMQWTFESLSDDGDEMTLTLSFDLFNHSDLAVTFPHHLLFSYEISLLDKRLRSSMTILNKGETVAPIGFGYHTWFSLFGSLLEWKLKLLYNGIWKLDESTIPTGEIVDLEVGALRKDGIALSEQAFDTVFHLGGNSFVSTLEHESGYSIIYSGSKQFKNCIVHSSKEDSKTIAIEPYTWVTNAPNLALPEATTGVIGIEPDKDISFSTVLEINRS